MSKSRLLFLSLVALSACDRVPRSGDAIQYVVTAGEIIQDTCGVGVPQGQFLNFRFYRDWDDARNEEFQCGDGPLGTLAFCTSETSFAVGEGVLLQSVSFSVEDQSNGNLTIELSASQRCLGGACEVLSVLSLPQDCDTTMRVTAREGAPLLDVLDSVPPIVSLGTVFRYSDPRAQWDPLIATHVTSVLPIVLSPDGSDAALKQGPWGWMPEGGFEEGTHELVGVKRAKMGLWDPAPVHFQRAQFTIGPWGYDSALDGIDVVGTYRMGDVVMHEPIDLGPLLDDVVVEVRSVIEGVADFRVAAEYEPGLYCTVHEGQGTLTEDGLFASHLDRIEAETQPTSTTLTNAWLRAGFSNEAGEVSAAGVGFGGEVELSENLCDILIAINRPCEPCEGAFPAQPGRCTTISSGLGSLNPTDIVLQDELPDCFVPDSVDLEIGPIDCTGCSASKGGSGSMGMLLLVAALLRRRRIRMV